MREVPSGFYFLRRLDSLKGYYRHTFEPKRTLFAAQLGQINYPGDWVVQVVVLSSSVSGSLARGSSSAEYEISSRVEENKDVAAKLQAKYPRLNAKLPLRLTRVENT